MNPSRPESPEYIHHVLRSLQNKQADYLGGNDVDDAISMKTMTALVGPSASGKSAIKAEVLLQDDEIKEINTTTTRAHRSSDQPSIETNLSYSDFNSSVIDERFVNFNVVGQNAYGTLPEGFSAQHNIGVIAPASVLQMLSYHWRRYSVAFTVMEGQEYEQRLRTSRMDQPDFLENGLEELKTLDFAQLNIDAGWLHCVESSATIGTAKAAAKVINIARGNTFEIMLQDKALEHVTTMRRTLQRVMSDIR